MQLFRRKNRGNDQGQVDAVVLANRQFALDLYRKLQGLEGNLFFSPYSISTALAMTYAGARGDTQAEMARSLHFILDQDQLHPALANLEIRFESLSKQGHVQLKVANNLFPRQDYKLLKAYLTLVKDYYRVRVTPMDFSDEETARQTINTWVEKQTDGRIRDLIATGVLDDATRLVLVNAIYFKGAWSNPFDAALTAPAPFLTGSGMQVQVPMMNQKRVFRYAEDNDFQVLELPYSSNGLSMFVFLPRKLDGLAKFEGALTLETLDRRAQALQETEVQVSLPRFVLDFPFRLDEVLQELGMLAAFSDQADFSGLDGSRQLFIGAVLHKAFVEVNELGTEAAAATAVVMQTKAMVFPSMIFRADHPFVFLIRENSTGSILFMGRLKDPGESASAEAL
jgi:serine protease inhibitor